MGLYRANMRPGVRKHLPRPGSPDCEDLAHTGSLSEGCALLRPRARLPSGHCRASRGEPCRGVRHGAHVAIRTTQGAVAGASWFPALTAANVQ